VTLLWADNRAYLTVGTSTRYAVGDPLTPDLTLNAVDAYGCMWAADTPDGWDAAEATTPLDRRQDGSGGYSGETTLEPRVLTVEGTVAAPTPAELSAAYRRWLAAVQRRGVFIRYTHLDELPEPVGVWVKPTGRPKWRALDDRVAEFSFLLVAEDPTKTGTAHSYGPVRLPTVGGEGGYPMGAGGAVMPWTAAGGTVAVTVVTVGNSGDEDSHAVYTVTGPASRPRIQLGNGQYVALAADLGPLDSWVVDTAAGTTAVNGVNRYDAWAAGSVFPLIPPGGVEVRLRSDGGGTDQAAGLTVVTASSWK
jgi:hypothetical protein